MKLIVFLTFVALSQAQFFPKPPVPIPSPAGIPGAGAIPGAGVIGGAASLPQKIFEGLDPSIITSFTDFVSKNNKNYLDESIASKALGLFTKNFNTVKDHNEKLAKGLVGFSMEVYDFMDQELSAWINKLCGTRVPEGDLDRRRRAAKKPDASSYPAGPASVDFTADCLPVVHQGECGSCWSFATIAQLESMYKRADPKFDTPISMQASIDCDGTNTGCGGGWPKKALDFLQGNELVSSAAYPYKGEKATCDAKAEKLKVPKVCDNYQYKLKGNEEALKNILAANGPVIVVVLVTEDFTAYKSGVFSDSTCSSECKNINHSVLLVGYGTDAGTGKDYWLLRNSWGADWGENGYIRIARNENNNCLTSCFAIFSKLC